MKESLALFSFGTLMDTDLLPLVCEQAMDTLVLESAVVPERSRRWVLDDHYPVLVVEEGRTTQGLIIRGLEEEAFSRIVFFEGEEFNLEPLSVQKANGEWERVQYFADTNRKQISASEWTLSEWQRTTKADTLSRIVGYMQCYGKMTLAEADAFW
ncbi:MAG: hypothetical protein ACI9UN_002792 [Granulosicoccus sp.]